MCSMRVLPAGCMYSHVCVRVCACACACVCVHSWASSGPAVRPTKSFSLCSLRSRSQPDRVATTVSAHSTQKHRKQQNVKSKEHCLICTTATHPHSHPAKGLSILDCRPRVNALGNVAKGGGWEIKDHYPFATVTFLGQLPSPNIKLPDSQPPQHQIA
jgi:hypothetical protein